MFRSKTLIKQHARSPLWLRAVLSFLLPLAALVFVPVQGSQLLPIALGLLVLSFVLLTYTFGLKSLIRVESDNSHTLAVYDSYSRAWAYLPFEHIRSFRVTEYALNDEALSELVEDQEYFRRFRVAAYSGPALVVNYQLPPQLSAENVMRSWLVAGPRAEELASLMREQLSQDADCNP